MKIKKLVVDGVLRIVVAEVEPGDRRVVEIVGKNESGKTSLMNAMFMALAGGTMPAEPIHRGKETGKIEVQIGGEQVELIVTKTFDKERGVELTVETPAGGRKMKPQTILSAMIGKISFDPVEFIRMKAPEQYTAMRSLVRLDVDIDELDELNRGARADRTDAGRRQHALRSQAEAIPHIDGLPAEKTDTKPILDKLTNAGAHNTKIQDESRRRSEERAAVARWLTNAAATRERANQLRREAEKADDEAARMETGAAEKSAELDNLPPLEAPIDAAALRDELTSVAATNEKVERRQRRLELEWHALHEQATVENYSFDIERREAAKAKAIREAKMPIPGLGFGNGYITFNDLPLDQASTAQKIRISVAIAMAANPALRVIFIREGSLLDDDGMATISQMAAERDYQVWVESVKDHGGPVIIMEEGRVKADTKPQGALI